MTQGDARWDGMSDAEFLADYEAKHGPEATRAIAKAMGMDLPKRLYRNAKHAAVGGAKPKPRKRLPPEPRRGVSWAEQHALHKAEGPPPEKARIITARFDGECKADECRVGERRFVEGTEVVQLLPSRRVVHGVCAPDAARDRVREWERWQANKGSSDDRTNDGR